MLNKPKDCVGCPYYGNGRGFIPDRIPENPVYILAMDTPNDNFSGQDAGDTAEAGFHKRSVLPYTDVGPHEVGFMHLLRCKAARAAKGQKGFRAKQICRAYDNLKDDSVVVASGPGAWAYFAGAVEGGRSEWFGYYVEAHNPNAPRDESGLEELFG